MDEGRQLWMPPEAKRKGVWERRYREIKAWEHYLVDNGLRIVKLFLNLSKEEQRIRFLRRCDLPDHNWKYVIPADRNADEDRCRWRGHASSTWRVRP